VTSRSNRFYGDRWGGEKIRASGERKSLRVKSNPSAFSSMPSTHTHTHIRARAATTDITSLHSTSLTLTRPRNFAWFIHMHTNESVNYLTCVLARNIIHVPHERRHPIPQNIVHSAKHALTICASDPLSPRMYTTVTCRRF